MPTMPTMYSRSRSSGSRTRKRLFRTIAGLISMILCYQVFIDILTHYDTTPHWARIIFTGIAIQGTPYRLEVDSVKLPNKSQVLVKAILMTTSNQYYGKLEVKGPMTSTRDREEKVFIFHVPNDPNIKSMQFTVAGYELPDEPNVPVEQCKRLTEPIQSHWIEVYPEDSPDAVQWRMRSSLENILTEAYAHGNWMPNRGDPTISGWGITLLYMAVGLCALYCTGAFQGRGAIPLSTYYAWFWWVVGIAILLLGVNKQLDLQILLADVGRTYAQVHGWYEQRKPVQIRTIALFATLGLGALEWFAYRLRRAPRSTWPAMAGMLLLALYVLLRMVGLHPIEHVMGLRWLRLELGDWVEIWGLLCIGLSGTWYFLTQRTQISYLIQ